MRSGWRTIVAHAIVVVFQVRRFYICSGTRVAVRVWVSFIPYRLLHVIFLYPETGEIMIQKKKKN